MLQRVRAVAGLHDERYWEEHAEALAPELWPLLRKANFCAAFLLETSDDVDLVHLLGRPVTVEEWEKFGLLAKEARTFASRKRRAVSLALASPGLAHVIQRKINERQALVAGAMGRLKAAPDSFPSAGKRAQQSKEEKRIQMVEKICKIIRDCCFPAALLISTSSAPDKIIARMGSGKRTSTLTQRVHVYRAMRSWLEDNIHDVWPREVVHVLDYLADRADQPCGVSVPAGVLTMLGFFEELGGVQSPDRLSKNSMVTAFAAELKLELSSANPKPKRKAWQLLLSFIIDWELRVGDGRLSICRRVNAWAHLVKTWAALRTADSCGVPSRRLKLDEEGLTGEIHISKTTGTGKKIGITRFFVSSKAFFCQKDWLKDGWYLYQQLNLDLQFFIPLPEPSDLCFSNKEPSYAQECTTLRKSIEETRVIVWRDFDDGFDAQKELDDEHVMSKGSQAFWGGHSGRATLNTWAAAVGYEKDMRDYINRCSPSESDEYVRISKAIILDMQSTIAEKVRMASGKDILHEEEVIKELCNFCAERGLSKEGIAKMQKNIESSRNVGTSSSPAGTTDLDENHISDEEHPDVPAPVAGSSSWVEDFTPGEAPEAFPFPSVGQGVWTVSQDRRGEASTLHRVGRCWRIPGTHYLRFAILDEEEIAFSNYRRVCKECFPKHCVEDTSSSSSDSASESSN